MGLLDTLKPKENIEFKPTYQLRHELYNYKVFIRQKFYQHLQEARLPYVYSMIEKDSTGFLLPSFRRNFIVLALKNFKYRGHAQYVGINLYGAMFLEIVHFLTLEPKLFKWFIPTRLEGLMSFGQFNEYLDLKSFFESADEILKLAILEAETDLEGKKLKKVSYLNIQ